MLITLVQAETHVIVEVYGMGNVILTDASYTILNVLRQHAPEEVIARPAARAPHSFARRPTCAVSEMFTTYTATCACTTL